MQGKQNKSFFTGQSHNQAALEYQFACFSKPLLTDYVICMSGQSGQVSLFVASLHI
jgi:hypothetical protein